MITGDELRDTRAFELNMTQQELAEHLGVSQRTIVNWEAKGVPERNEVRVMRRIGHAVEAMRQQYRSWADGTPRATAQAGRASAGDSSSPRRSAELVASVELAERVNEESAASPLAGVTDAELLEELARRLAARTHMSEQPARVDYMLAAMDRDDSAELEAWQNEP